jgi:hypothetical protein
MHLRISMLPISAISLSNAYSKLAEKVDGT